jgi:hypothetical protein
VANSLVFVLICMHKTTQNFAAVSQTSGLRDIKHVLVWGGLRGPLALALAPGLPAEPPGAQKSLQSALRLLLSQYLFSA